MKTKTKTKTKAKTMTKAKKMTKAKTKTKKKKIQPIISRCGKPCSILIF